MSEPFGAVLASLVANEQSSDQAFGSMFGLTGGMMLYVCIAELLPAAYGEKGVSRDAVTVAFFLGCAVMARISDVPAGADTGNALTLV